MCLFWDHGICLFLKFIIIWKLRDKYILGGFMLVKTNYGKLAYFRVLQVAICPCYLSLTQLLHFGHPEQPFKYRSSEDVLWLATCLPPVHIALGWIFNPMPTACSSIRCSPKPMHQKLMHFLACIASWRPAWTIQDLFLRERWKVKHVST